MKQWMAALTIALAAGSVHAGDWTGKEIRLAVDPTYPPLEYKLPDGTLTGFGIDITNLTVSINQHWKLNKTDIAGAGARCRQRYASAAW